MDEPDHPAARVVGLHPDDVSALRRALSGLHYPVPKWQLLAYATRPGDGERAIRWRTVDQLWALPDGLYTGFAQVVRGAARTARGHPRRVT